MEGFYLVKSIVREVVDPQQVFMRDTLSYCGVLLDDNNRRPICRLLFNEAQKHIGIFDTDKKITRHQVDNLNEIYKFATEIKETTIRYDTPSTEQADGMASFHVSLFKEPGKRVRSFALWAVLPGIALNIRETVSPFD